MQANVGNNFSNEEQHEQPEITSKYIHNLPEDPQVNYDPIQLFYLYVNTYRKKFDLSKKEMCALEEEYMICTSH